MKLTYEIEWSVQKDVVWVHASDGSTVGRFGKMGVDLHNTITEQMNGAPECRLCTHGKPTIGEWEMFINKALEWWGVVVPMDAFNHQLLIK